MRNNISLKRHILLFGFFIVAHVAVAQWTFTTSVSKSGNCPGLEALGANIWAAIGQGVSGQNNFATKEQCEASRAGFSGTYSEGGCTTRVITTPCKGPAGALNGVDILGPSKGSSFYSTNPVNEINDWSKDEAIRRMGLDKNYTSDESTNVLTGDDDFDRIIENMHYSDEAISGRMPAGSTVFIEKPKENVVEFGPPSKSLGVKVSDDFMTTPFDKLGVWHSDDLKPLNVDLKPVPNGIKTFDEEGWDLWRDGLKLGKDMGMFVYGLQGVAETTVAIAGLLADLNINLCTEVYKAYRKSYMGEAYEAADPNNLYTEAAVFWGGKEYAIVGNIFYNAASATLDDFVSFIDDEAKNKISESAINEVRNKALKESVSNSLPDTGKGIELLNIAKNSFDFGGKWVEYHKKQK